MTALLFLHVLAAMALVGAAIAAAAAGLAARRAGHGHGAALTIAVRAAVGTAAAALVAVASGEALAAERDVVATWLDVARALAIVGLLGGGLVAAVLARLSTTRPGLAGAAGWVSAAVAVLALAVTFLMAAQPT